MFAVLPFVIFCLYNSPNRVFTLGVLTVTVNDGCLIGGAHRRVLLIRCWYIHSEIFEVHPDCAGSQNLLGPSGDMFSELVITFRGRCKRNLVFWMSTADFS